jgi:diacylglycerol kinase family enzyme
LPGGTANIIAADLNLGSDVSKIVQMYVQGAYDIEYYDSGSANAEPFVLDMHFGVWSEGVKNAPRQLKKKLGPAAYALSALKRLPAAEKQTYEIEFDGKARKVQSYTTMIANQGFQNFLGFPLFTHSHRQGIIQVAFIKSLNPYRFFIWMLGKTLKLHNLGGAITTYRAKKVVIKHAPKDCFYDDHERSIKLPFVIKGGQYQTRIIIPPKVPKKDVISRSVVFAQLMFVRLKERLRNGINGNPRQDYTQFAPYLYVGGAYRRSAYKRFKQWGVTGIVNMRYSTPPPAPDGFTVLHLKTRDWTPPTLDALTEGVEFIQSRAAKGEGVYIHCRQGEGRGPTMAAAYLISQGFTVEESLKLLKKSRPMARPNRSQVRKLMEWQSKQDASSKH